MRICITKKVFHLLWRIHLVYKIPRLRAKFEKKSDLLIGIAWTLSGSWSDDLHDRKVVIYPQERIVNSPRLICYNSNMTLRLQGQNCKYLTTPLSHNSQRRPEHKDDQTKYRNMTRKPRSHVRTLMNQTRAIAGRSRPLSLFREGFLCLIAMAPLTQRLMVLFSSDSAFKLCMLWLHNVPLLR